jgi:hypothetical protein
MTKGKFYVVIKQSDNRLVRHEKYIEAENAARILVLKEKERFFIMRSVVVAEIDSPPVRFTGIPDGE